MTNVIFIFGPSCSGKSTLGKALQYSLGREWTYLDRDDLIEQHLCTESNANKTLDEKIRSLEKKIIVDAQIPWRKKRSDELYFMVLPPLKILLERDQARTIKLQRTDKRAHYAHQYVIETFNTLSNLDKTIFNHCFDSSQESIPDEVSVIKSIINCDRHVYINYFYLAVAGFSLSIICAIHLKFKAYLQG